MNRLVEFIKDCSLAVFIAILLMVISGCATTQEPVPILVPCKVELPQEPSYRFLPPYDDIFTATRDLLGDREVSLAYEATLRDVIRACQ